MRLFLVMIPVPSTISPDILLLEMPDETTEEDVAVFVMNKRYRGAGVLVVHEVSGDAKHFSRSDAQTLEDRDLTPTGIGSFVVG